MKLRWSTIVFIPLFLRVWFLLLSGQLATLSLATTSKLRWLFGCFSFLVPLHVLVHSFFSSCSASGDHQLWSSALLASTPLSSKGVN